MGIPLPALSIHTQQPSPLEQYAQLQQIQGGQQQQQLRDIAIQEAKQGQIDRAATTKAMQDWDGKDYTQLPSMILKNGGSSNAVFAATQHIQDIRSKASEIAKNDAATGESTLETQIKTNDQYRGRLQAIIGAPAEQKQDMWDKEITSEEQAGKIQPGTVSHQYPGDGQATYFANHFALGSTLAREATEKEQAAAKTSEAATAATKAQTEAAEFKEKMPGGALNRVTQDIAVATNPDIQRGKLQLAIAEGAARNAMMNNTGLGNDPAAVAKQFGMSPVAFDQAAEKYWISGQLPPSGRGGPALATNKAIMNRAAELHPEGSLAANSAEYKANAASLSKLQSNLDQVSAFENTANKNLDMFTNLAQKAINTGIPLLNAPLRTGAKLLAGSEDQLAMDAARQVAVNEIAKVTSNPGLVGQLSDTARKEVEAFIPANATYGQALRVAKVLKQDMANRHQSYQEQVNDIRGRLGGSGGSVNVSGGGGHIIKIGNDQYQYNGSGDTADLKNYTKLP